jgi:cytochrome c-type biogenesis protein CcmH
MSRRGAGVAACAERMSRAASIARALAPVACTLAALLAPPAALAVTARTTLPAIESQAMCVTCKIPLTVAQSPQADRERAFIAHLIATGQDEAQIKRELVREYGPAVLALPSTHGFDLTVYVVPPVVVLALLGLVALLLPRWRRRARAASGPTPADSSQPALSPTDTARLDADMARFE